MKYTIVAHVAYEGMCITFEGTKEECQKWLKSDGRKYHYNLEDLEIYFTQCDLDIYELYNA